MTETGVQKRHRDYISSWVWLIALASYSTLLLIGIISYWSRNYSNSALALDRFQLQAISISVIALSIIFIVAALLWKKWGAFGVYAIATGAIAVSFTLTTESSKPDAALFIEIGTGIGLALLIVTAMVVHYRKAFEDKLHVSRQVGEIVGIEKPRPIGVAFWAIYLLVTNSLLIGSYPILFMTAMLHLDLSQGVGSALTLAGSMLNIVFGLASIMWKKWGFIGLACIAMTTIVPSIFILVIGGQSYITAGIGPLILSTVGTVALVRILRPIWKQLSWK